MLYAQEENSIRLMALASLLKQMLTLTEYPVDSKMMCILEIGDGVRKVLLFFILFTNDKLMCLDSINSCQGALAASADCFQL